MERIALMYDARNEQRPVLSLQQEQLWFTEQHGLQPGAYNEARIFRVEGQIDLRALKLAWSSLLERRSVLRQIFPEQDAAPRRRTLPVPAIPLDHGSWRGVRSPRSHLRLATEFCERPYDFANGPLCRLGCFELDAGRSILLFALHHVLMDGHSLDLVIAELAALYSAAVTGSPPSASDCSEPYEEFIEWQDDYFGSPACRLDRAFWKEQLAGAPVDLDLGTGPGTGGQRGRSGAVEIVDVPAEAVANAARLGRRFGVTAFSIFFSLYARRLHRLSGLSDLLVGTGAPARPGSRFANSVGLFANMLPIRSTLSPGESVEDHIRRESDVLLDALDHQLLPFNRIMSCADPASRQFRPLIQHVFTMWQRRDFSAAFSGLSVEEIDIPRSRSRFSTLAELVAERSCHRLHIEYDTAAVRRRDVLRLGRGFVADLAALDTLLSRRAGGKSLNSRPPAEHRDETLARRHGGRPASSAADPVVMREILQIWGVVLRRPAVSQHDNFFEIGGRSILALQVTSRMTALAGARVPVRLLFDHPVALDYCIAVTPFLADVRAELASRAATRVPTMTAPQPKLDRGTGPDLACPLAETQLQLWVNEKLAASDMRDFTASVAYRIRGTLDLAAFRAAFTAVANRHEMLRAMLHVTSSGWPEWIIGPTAETEIPQIDLRGATGGTGEQLVARLVRSEADKCRCIDGRRLFRILLIRMGDAESLFLFSQHHLITDAVSLRVVMEELGQAYEQLIAGQFPRLEASSKSFAEYVAEESRWLSGPAAQEARAFWRSRLADLPEGALPSEGTGVRETFRTRACTARLTATATRRLQRLARAERTTPFALIVSAWAACLARWTRAVDVVIGINAENRHSADVERLVGCLVNPLPLRVGIGSDMTFRDLLRAVRDGFLEAYERQRLPFREIVRATGVRPEKGRMPIFRTIVDWVAPEEAALRLEGCATSLAYVPMETNRYDLALYARLEGGQLHVELEFATDLWTEDTIARRLAFMITLLSKASTGFDISIPGQEADDAESAGNQVIPDFQLPPGPPALAMRGD